MIQAKVGRKRKKVVRPQPEPLSPAAFKMRKLILALQIMGVGLLIAMCWDDAQEILFEKAYPFSTFLFFPNCRFSDLADTTLMASRPNPYVDPIAFYLPLTWLFMRPFAWMSHSLAMIIFFSISLGSLYLVLVKSLEAVVVKPSLRVVYSLLFLCTSYPILFCFDRGNIEILLASLVACALLLLAKRRYGFSLLCLIPAISFKIFPAFLLVLLLRQRRLLWTIVGFVASMAIIVLSLALLSLPLAETLKLYSRDANFYLHNYVYESWTMESSASLWNAYKVGLSALNLFLNDPIDFTYDGPFIHSSYFVYSMFMLLLTVCITLNAVLFEKVFLRCAIPVLLFMSMSVPAAGDYRLLYAGIGLVMLIVIPTKRQHDWLALVLLALTMVPKKELLLPFAGHTETGFYDVSIQVVLNPLFVFVAMLLMLHDSVKAYDPRWIKLRCQRLIRDMAPWLIKPKPTAHESRSAVN